MDLKAQKNEQRCFATKERHTLQIAECCPVSKNPRPGSKIEIEYAPAEHVLEVQALRGYVDSYVGGRGDVRSMEGMIQQIATDCAKVLRVDVVVTASLLIEPRQEMWLQCTGKP